RPERHAPPFSCPAAAPRRDPGLREHRAGPPPRVDAMPGRPDLLRGAAPDRVAVLRPAGLVVVAVLRLEADVADRHLVALAELRQKDLRGLDAVYGETGTGLQAPRHRCQEFLIALVAEEPEARAAAEGAVEFLSPGKVSHVGFPPRDCESFAQRSFAGGGEESAGDIHAGQPVAAPGELDGVPSVAARHVEQPGSRARRELSLEEV